MSEKEIEHSYKVLEALTGAFDYVATKPEKAGQLVVELIESLPDVVDALMVITKDEHRPILAEVVGSAARMVRSWSRVLKSKSSR